MLRLKVKDKANLVIMHQIKSVKLVEYYLGNNITTITKNTWPWLLTFDLDLDFHIWPWDWCIITLMLWKNNCVTWRKNSTSFVISETKLPICISSKNILQPTKSFQSYGPNCSKVMAQKVNLVNMHQMKSVQWVEYYLGYYITTIAKNTWPWFLTFDLDIHCSSYVWPWHFKVIWSLIIHRLFPCMTIDDFMRDSYDKSLVQILNWTVTETDAKLIILIRFLIYLVQILLFYTSTQWNLIRFLSLKLRKLFLNNFA